MISAAIHEKMLSWWEMALIWGGINFCLPTLMVGALAVPSLNWTEALAANLAGNLICGLITALGGMPGIVFRQPSVIIATHFFGVLAGAKVIAAAIAVATVGWFAVMLSDTADILGRMWPVMPQSITAWLGLAMTACAALGSRGVLWSNYCSLPVLAIGTGYIYFLIVGNDYGQVLAYTPTGEMGWGEAVNYIVASFILGAFCASDFTRLARDNRANWLGAVIGVSVVSSVLAVAGMYAKAVTGDYNPLAVWLNDKATLPLGITILLVATWTTNQALLYSAGIALSRLSQRLNINNSAVVAGLAGTALACLPIANRLEILLIALSGVFPALLGSFLGHFWLSCAYSDRLALYSRVFWPSLGVGALVCAILPSAAIPAVSGILFVAVLYYYLGRIMA